MTNKKTKTTKKTKEEPLLVLSDLVENSKEDYAIIIGCLVESGLYSQYERELELKKYNLPIKASITQTEFDEIIKLLGV